MNSRRAAVYLLMAMTDTAMQRAKEPQARLSIKGTVRKQQRGYVPGLPAGGQSGDKPAPSSTQFGPGSWITSFRDQPMCCSLMVKRANSGVIVLNLHLGFAPISY